MSIELSFAPSFLYQGEIHTQEVMVFKLDVAVGIPGAVLIHGTDGREVELQATSTYIQWRYVGAAAWTNLKALSELEGEDGTNGREVEIRTNFTHIQWRLTGDPDWVNLVAISNLEGEPGANGVPVELQKSATHLQWRLVGSPTWIDLVDLSELEGTPGDPGGPGPAIELQKGVTHVQWRVQGSSTWIDLLPLTDLQGTPGAPGNPGTNGVPVELRKNTTHVQWRLEGAVTWIDLIALADLKGEAGDSPVLVAGAGVDVDNTDPLAPIVSATFSGSYIDLTDKPAIPDDPADIGAATAAQGTKADSALQPADVGVSVASLVAGLVPSSQLPSFVDDVLDFADYAALPATGESGKIYILATPYTVGDVTSSQFRWSGSAYVPIIASPGSTDAVTEGSTNLYFTASRVLAAVLSGLSTATSAVITGADTVLSAFGKLQAQLTALANSVSNVNNTSDVDKPVSTAQQNALDLKANAANPAFTGTATGLTKSMVGLGSVDNTADTAKPVSTAQQTALNQKLTNPMTTGGDIVFWGNAGAALRLAKGSNGQVLTLASGLPSWATPYSNPMTTSGDILYGGASGVATRLAKGTDGQYLTLVSGLPAWAALPADAVPTVNGKTGAVIVRAPIIVACSDETTALTAGNGKVTFRMPYAFTLTGVRASLTTAQTSGSIFTVDINEGGTTILSTKLTIDNTEKTSTTAATAAVMSDTALADDAEITVDIDQIGDGTAKGLKITLIGYQP